MITLYYHLVYTANVMGGKTPSYWRVTLWETEGFCINTFSALFNEIFDLFISMNGLCWKYSGGLQSYPLYKAANFSMILGQNQGQLFILCKVILKDAKLLKYCKSYVHSKACETFFICQLKIWHDQIWSLDLRITSLLCSPLDQGDLLNIWRYFWYVVKCCPNASPITQLVGSCTP